MNSGFPFRLRLLFLIILLACRFEVAAQVPLSGSGERPTFIATKWFGPYAYPVPDMNSALTSDKLGIQLGGECSIGHIGGAGNEDYTCAPTFRLSAPLWTDRVNLICWGEFKEWWKDTPRTRELRRYPTSATLSRWGHGQIWFGLDMMALREKKYSPSVVISLNLLTANGGAYEWARHYDAAGYHATVSAGKSFGFGAADSSGVCRGGALRLSAVVGFLCWQTDRAAQNDAILFGGMLSYQYRFVSASVEYSGYMGWEGNGDAPRVLKGRLDFHAGRFSPFLRYAHGFNDWPFDQISCGLRMDIKVLKD